MTDVSDQMIEILDRRVERRNERREFFKTAIGAAAIAGAGGALTFAGSANAQSAPTDADVLNFALNLEYLEAQFYNVAVFGTTLTVAQTTGTGTPGSRRRSQGDLHRSGRGAICQGDRAGRGCACQFLRAQLGASAVAQPAIDIGVAHRRLQQRGTRCGTDRCGRLRSTSMPMTRISCSAPSSSRMSG
jgi:hypothetical protein